MRAILSTYCVLDITLAFYLCRYHSIHSTLDNYAYFISTAAEVMKLAQGHTAEKNARASLVAQWLRICLPMQGTRVRALVWEDPTCRGAAGPVSHSY